MSKETGLGKKLFIVAEILIFGGLFCAFAIYRGYYPEMFHEGHISLNKVNGAVSTLVILLSSLTMALAVQTAKTKTRSLTSWLLALTFIFGLVFIGLRLSEYHHKTIQGFFYADYFKLAHFHVKDMGIFLSFYYLMTGLQGLHVILGLLLVAWLWARSRHEEFSDSYYGSVELTGQYWQVVDLIWIFLFPLLYLIG